MADPTLTLRDLNRATLARQHLVAPAALTVPELIDHLVGLQAQAAAGPYVGLWSRLDGFGRDDLARLVVDRTVVKAAWLRGTLHLVTADDYRRHRATLQPMLTAAFEDIAKRRGPGVDVDAAVAAARERFAESPCTFAQLSAFLKDRWPDADVGSLRHAVRMHLPIVQVPVDKGWGFPGNPQFTPADEWLGAEVPTDPAAGGDGDPEAALDELVRRYLGAFGPAGVTDVQAWSGLPAPLAKAAVERLRPSLAVFKEGRTELFDLPDAPRPAPDEPVPPRFLGEFDNVLLSHRKRTRIVADEHRKEVYLPALRVAPTVLVDGFVAGTWSVAKAKGEATLEVTLFGKPAKADRDALAADGERLVRFVEPDAKSHVVRL
jgi:hypothetical protein